MRTAVTFGRDVQLAGVGDLAPGDVGLLIVSGGNEIAAGPRGAMARLARTVADSGFPVFRFDRRGIGDSDGENAGWKGSRDDIAAAMGWGGLRGPSRVVAFGNCDAATALVLHDLTHGPVRLDGIGRPIPSIVARVLGNPWLGRAVDDLPPPAAVRRRYAQRLRDPAAWLRLARGRIDWGKLRRGLAVVGDRAAPPLAAAFAAGLLRTRVPTTIVLSRDDATAIGFASTWRGNTFANIRKHVEMVELPTASHGFTTEPDLAALSATLLAILKRVAALTT